MATTAGRSAGQTTELQRRSDPNMSDDEGTLRDAVAPDDGFRAKPA